VELIRELFFAPDADSIMSIPLRSSVGDDWLAWSKENLGYILCDRRIEP
jgi:hypothetical protein